MTTASSSAPTNLSRYNLLVVGSPTYAGNPAPPIERYIGRLGNLNHKSTVIIGTAAGTNPSTIAMKDRVQSANGTIVKTLSLYTQAPNNGDPTSIAKQAGEEISPP
jgi:flavorubredoxin